ncbi:MAG: TetR/AcrR family transcriptional regulator [Actinomycetota bacterium]|nr:TetR/AcrR family transcriptional regulator [Actinomycetota bacterium]
MRRDPHRKRRIVHAAAELFAAQGYHGVGMSQLEKAVDLQRGALYHHIGNKEALLYEIAVSPLQEMVRLASEIAARIDDPEERFRELARAILVNVADNRHEWTVHYRDFGSLTGERLETVLALRGEYEQIWRDTLRAGIERGRFVAPDVDLTTRGILGMFNHTWLWLEPDGAVDPREIADRYCDLFLTGIRAG